MVGLGGADRGGNDWQDIALIGQNGEICGFGWSLPLPRGWVFEVGVNPVKEYVSNESREMGEGEQTMILTQYPIWTTIPWAMSRMIQKFQNRSEEKPTSVEL